MSRRRSNFVRLGRIELYWYRPSDHNALAGAAFVRDSRHGHVIGISGGTRRFAVAVYRLSAVQVASDKLGRAERGLVAAQRCESNAQAAPAAARSRAQAGLADS